MYNIVNGFFVVDIVLTCFVAYIDKATYLFVDNPKQIAWKYARTWLTFNVVFIILSGLIGKLLPAPIQTTVYSTRFDSGVCKEFVLCFLCLRRIETMKGFQLILKENERNCIKNGELYSQFRF